jgi:hypothetical protein
MPHLTYKGSVWRINGDELALPICWAIVGRTFWFVVVSTYLARLFPALRHCIGGRLISGYLIISLLVYALMNLLDMRMAYLSARGTMVQTELREGLGLCVMIRVYLAITNGLNSVVAFASIGYLSEGIPCGESKEVTAVNLTILCLIVTTQLLNAFLSILCCQLCTTRTMGADRSVYEEEKEQVVEEKKWERGLSRIANLCGNGRIEKQGIREVAKGLVLNH